jgi:lysophospholipase L1-like esterase
VKKGVGRRESGVGRQKPGDGRRESGVGRRTGVGIGGLILVGAVGLSAQTPVGLMNARDINQLCQRSMQLMEAGGVAVPDLQRAGAPIIENVRQACIQIQARTNAGQPTYSFMTNLRAYLVLADAVPKPFPFPEVAARQFAELRDESARLDSHFRALLDQKDSQLRTADRDNLNRYAEANRKAPPPDGAKGARVVFFGDSITDFWRLNEYFPDRDFVNRGISGQITGEMLGRMKADVIDLHPDAVLILAGTNDLAREIPLIVIENNFAMIADLASYYKIKVIFASVLPVSDYHKDQNASYERIKDRPPVFIKALNDWLQSFCSQRGYTYLDYFSAMADQTGQLTEDLSDDGLHPNSKGYRVMAPLALNAIQQATVPHPKPQEPKPMTRRKTSK